VVRTLQLPDKWEEVSAFSLARPMLHLRGETQISKARLGLPTHLERSFHFTGLFQAHIAGNARGMQTRGGPLIQRRYATTRMVLRVS